MADFNIVPFLMYANDTLSIMKYHRVLELPTVVMLDATIQEAEQVALAMSFMYREQFEKHGYSCTIIYKAEEIGRV